MSIKCEKYIENVFYCCIIKVLNFSKGVIFYEIPNCITTLFRKR